jgi:hypothetical protein
MRWLAGWLARFPSPLRPRRVELAVVDGYAQIQRRICLAGPQLSSPDLGPTGRTDVSPERLLGVSPSGRQKEINQREREREKNRLFASAKTSNSERANEENSRANGATNSGSKKALPHRAPTHTHTRKKKAKKTNDN